MDATEQVSLAQIVGQMLIADGCLADPEREHLEKVMNALGMDAAAKKQVIGGIDVDSPLEERVAAMAADTRGRLISELEAAMHASGHVEPGEVAMLDRVKALLG